MRTELKFIVFKLSGDNKEIVVDTQSESASYDDFLEALPPNSPRYAVYDFEYEKGEGKRNKLCFYAWCVPSSCLAAFFVSRALTFRLVPQVPG